MKKRVLLLLAVVFVFSIILGACGSKKPINVEGTTWVIDSLKDKSGNKATDEDFESLGMKDYKVEFKKDGVMTVSAAGVTVDGTWSQSDNIVTVDDGQKKLEYTLDGNKMTITENGYTFTLKKQ